MRINRLGGDDKFAQILREVRQVQQAAMLGNSSVTNGRTRFAGNESLIVEGSQKVSGWLIVTGTLKVVGAFLLEGATTMTGNLISSGTALFTGAFTTRGTTRFEGDTTQKGAFHVEGPTDVTGNLTARGTTRLEGDTTQQGAFHVVGNQDNTGTLDIGGVTTLRKDLNVVSGGRIVAGNTSFNPNGSIMATTLLNIIGTSGINLAGTTTVAGAFTNSSISTGTGAANVYTDGVGRFWRASSASRYKITPELMDLPDALLDVPVRAWIDLGNAERFAELYDAPRPFTREQQANFDGADLSRVPGVVAEEVEAAGGHGFVTYGPDGVIEGVAYDRYALARTQILADRLEAALARIDALEAAA